MFSVGDKVVYPVHGAGIIESIENREVLGHERDYYILKIFFGDMRLLIPVETVDEAGVREIIPAGEVAAVLNIFRESNDEAVVENWNHRYRSNMERIKSGDIHNVAAVVRNLMLRDHDRGLSAGEKKMLEYARRILVSELMLAKDESEAEIMGQINRFLPA